MSTYALLGATGSTGSGVLRCLLSEPPAGATLNILVRSKSKLLQAFPKLDETTAAIRIRIVEGTSTDPAALEPCLDDAAVVFMCVGSNESRRGTTLSSDTAAAMVDALQRLRTRRGAGYQTPTVLQLRTASLNPALARQAPRIVRAIVAFCMHHHYADMQRACALYESAATETVLHYVWVDPPTIHDAAGTARTGHRLIATEAQRTALSYADLGAAMCEIARRRAEFRNRPVGVTATGRVRATWRVLAGYLLTGARDRIVGWLTATRPDAAGAMTLWVVCCAVAAVVPGWLALRSMLDSDRSGMR